MTVAQADISTIYAQHIFITTAWSYGWTEVALNGGQLSKWTEEEEGSLLADIGGRIVIRRNSSPDTLRHLSALL